MTSLFGITNLQVAIFTYTDDVNRFLIQHDGNIVQIQNGTNDIMVIYREKGD